MRVVILAALIAWAPISEAACIVSRTSDDRIKRSAWQVKQFRKAIPCPATGLTTGRCPGYVVDHVVPLCACGPDKPSNMQWQTLADSKVKDVQEVRICRLMKKVQ